MIQGAIFDVDGTLTDSMVIWRTAGERYLRSLGCEPKENLYETIKTMSMQESASYFQQTYGVTHSTEEIMDGIDGMIAAYYETEAMLKPGTEHLLSMLQSYGVSMCIATATDRHLIETALKRCGIRSYFSEIFTSRSVGKGKSEPLIYRTALAHLGTEKRKTVVFEDALYAARTASADGFPVVGVPDFYEKDQDTLRSFAGFWLSDYTDLSKFRIFLETL